MSNLYQDIRTALQDQAATAVGFPVAARRAYENSKFVPPASAAGVSWVAMAVRPIEDKPYSVSGDAKKHQGLFLINVYTPFNEGPAACEALVDNIRSVFDPSGNMKQGGITIFLDYAQRGPLIPDAEWAMIPITVGWRAYTPQT